MIKQVSERPNDANVATCCRRCARVAGTRGPPVYIAGRADARETDALCLACHHRSILHSRFPGGYLCVTCGEEVFESKVLCDACYATRRRAAEHKREGFVLYEECDWCSRRPSECTRGMALCHRCFAAVS